ncbi:MAG: ricin-type beta-trefoil lectin domain protein, partial [Mycobacteriaceae bacterium]
AKTNEYKREMQISVLDMRDQWHVQDPMGYPYGDPSFKLDRMIYSDAVGTTTQTFAAPANVTNPLSAITAWTTRVTVGSYTNRNWLTAIQANGARTGATSTGTPTTYNGAPGSTLGPVVQVDTTWDQKSNSSQKVIGTVRFHFSDGTTAAPGGDFYDRGTCNSTPPCTTSWTFENEVLATAKIMGSYQITTGTYVGDSMVLGFRPADSFSPQWHGSLPGALRAPNTQACLGVTQVTLTSGGTTGSRADGAPLQMRNCSSTAWDQTWQYIDYNDPNDPESAAAQHELTVYAGSKCAAPKDGATATGTPVQVYGCDETPPQKWTRHSDGTITNDQSGLCLERAGGAVSNGTPLQLNTCNSSDAQNWNWP